MRRKEFLKKEEASTRKFYREGKDSQPRIPGLSSRSFAIIKFILGVCLLPFVYACSVSFINEINLIHASLQRYFWSGLVSFLIIYLFVWEPQMIYATGQRLVEIVFSFFRPLVRAAPYLLPIYTIVLFISYVILSSMVKSMYLTACFIFLFGSSIGLHLVFSAKSIRSKQGDFLRANYIFGFSWIYIINLTVAAVLMSFVFKKFSLVDFFSNSFRIAENIFCMIFKQFFLG